jgi:N-acetylglucosamine kinase-like BadF-type ATPase
MLEYVIGIESSLHEFICTAADLNGNVLSKRMGPSTNHMTIGKKAAQSRISEMITELLASFGGEKAGCRCMIVGAAGIDSPNAKMTVADFFSSLQLMCPVFCLNDGSVALYATTQGLGVMAISGAGSIAVGRNNSGTITRSGGYPITIFGNEGSGQWISLSAMRHASMWIDGSIPQTLLISKIDAYFKGLDVNKLNECTNALRRRPIDIRIANLVFEASEEGDVTATALLRGCAHALFEVTDTCVMKLGFDKEPFFLSGVWGSVFTSSKVYFDEYKALFQDKYPQSKVIFPSSDTADGAAQMALAYLDGKIPFINDLQ